MDFTSSEHSTAISCWRIIPIPCIIIQTPPSITPSCKTLAYPLATGSHSVRSGVFVANSDLEKYFSHEYKWPYPFFCVHIGLEIARPLLYLPTQQEITYRCVTVMFCRRRLELWLVRIRYRQIIGKDLKVTFRVHVTKLSILSPIYHHMLRVMRDHKI